MAEQLLEQIIQGRLKAGDRLKELALAREQAVSRTTIREALIILEKWHFAERIPRVGARVTLFGKEDIAGQYEIRGVLLGLAAARCASRGDATLDRRLSDLADEMVRLAEDPGLDPDRFAVRSIEAAEILVEGSGNHYLPKLYRLIIGMAVSQLVRGRSLAFRTPERRRESARDWRAIADAVLARDAAAAEQAMRLMVAHSGAGVIAELTVGGTAPG